MPTNVLLGHRKYAFFQTNVTDEANTDAGGTFGAGESTLVNSLKAKVNSLLTGLRAAGIINGTVVKTGSVWGGKSGRFLQANITAAATADSDAVYGQPEADLINELKAKMNLIIAALNAAGFGGAQRHLYTGYLAPRQQITLSYSVATITTADADATYGAPEQTLINEIKAKLNSTLAACRAAKVITV